MGLDDSPSSIFRNSATNPSALIPISPPAPAGTQVNPAPTMSLGALISALGRRWLQAATIGPIAALCVAMIAWVCMPSAKDTVRALLHVNSSLPRVLDPQGNSGRADFNFITYQRTQIALLKTRLVLNAALRQPGVSTLQIVQEQSDPVQWLEKEIKADFSTGPEILRVSMATDRPEEARVLVNAITKSYLEEIVNKDQYRRREQLEKLKTTSAKYEELLRRKRAALKETAETIGTTDGMTLALKQRFAQEQLGMAQKELLQTESELRRLQIELSTQGLRNAGARDILVSTWAGPAAQGWGILPWGMIALESPGISEDPGFIDPVIVDALLDQHMLTDSLAQKYQTQKAQLEEEFAQSQRVAKARTADPHYDKELEVVRRALAARREELRPLVERMAREKNRMDRRATVGLMTRRLTMLTALKKGLAAEVKQLTEDSHSLGRGAVSVESYRHDITQTEEMARKLAMEVEVFTVELDAPSRVSPLEEAVILSGDSRQRRLITTGGAAVGTLALILLLIALREYRAQRISTVAEITESLKLHVVGTVPVLPGLKTSWLGWVGLDTGEEIQGRLTEAVDATRTMILHTATKIPLQIVMVTSAVGGEGKTSLSGHLAASLARAGRRTLLIDCDLRNPAAHRLFSAPSGPGFCEVIRGLCPVEQAIQATSTPGLSLLPAGMADAQVFQSLVQDHLRQILTTLRHTYDFLIIDTSPILPVTDALLIGQHVDAVVLSVMQGVSKMPLVQAANEKLAMLEIPILGAVVCGMRDTAQRYAYRARPVAFPEENNNPCETSSL